MSWQFNFTENGTTTLATAGKYCDRNIDINVDVEGEASGGYDITATANDDGTQSLAIVDAGSGGGASGVLTAQVTIDCSYVNADQSVWVEYATKDQEWAEISIAGGNTTPIEIETLQGSMVVAWPGSDTAYNNNFGVGVSGEIEQSGLNSVYFKVNGDGNLFIWSN